MDARLQAEGAHEVEGAREAEHPGEGLRQNDTAREARPVAQDGEALGDPLLERGDPLRGPDPEHEQPEGEDTADDRRRARVADGPAPVDAR